MLVLEGPSPNTSDVKGTLMHISWPLSLKIHFPSSFTNFRPITPLNFSYKIITKIIANKLSVILSNIILHNQAAFVKGKFIHHHIALCATAILKPN